MRRVNEVKRLCRSLTLALLVLVAAFLIAGLRQPIRTLSSLRRVDDHPLYVMRYYGGYLFDWYLR